MNPEDIGIENEESPASADDLTSAVRRLYELRRRRDETKAAYQTAKKEFEEYQAEFFENYSNSKIKGSLTVDLGEEFGTVQITPQQTYFGRILNADDARAYFRERELSGEYVKDDFRMARVHELVRECIEQKKPLPPGLDYYTNRYFRITQK